MKSKLTIKTLLMMAFMLFHFSNINAQKVKPLITVKPLNNCNSAEGFHVTDAQNTAIPSAVVKYHVCDFPNEEFYYWRVQRGTFSNGQTIMQVFGGEGYKATVTWSDDCNELSQGGTAAGARIACYLGSLEDFEYINGQYVPSSTTPVYSTFTALDLTCDPDDIPTCADLQVQIDAILANNNLSALDQVTQVQAIVNSNPNCNFTICN